MNTPVLRRLKRSSSNVANVPTFRIVVFGQSGVGKTAMSVRFVTKRFIGEYDPTLENIYQHNCVVGGNTVLFEIMDTAGQEENEVMMEEKIRWADAFILVYAINDQTSFDEIPRLKFTISHTMAHQQHKSTAEPVITVVGNKSDLEPDRMVDRLEGEQVAKSLRSQFCEISVRDGVYDVMKVFEETYLEFRRKASALHAVHDGVSTFKRKEKSFKYVDRIPRMQGRKRNYIINDVTSDMMMTKIDECSEDLENRLKVDNDSNRNSLTNGYTNGFGHEEPPRRSLGRRRRNAVVGFGSSKSISDNALLMNGHEAEVAEPEYTTGLRRRHTLTASTYTEENSTDEEIVQDRSHVPPLTRHHTMRQYDANDTNNNLTKAHHRRCRSQEVMDASGSQMLDDFPHHITRYVGKRRGAVV